MFVVLVTYTKPIEEIDKVLVPHRQFLDTLYADGILLASGPQNPRTGGVLVAKGMDRGVLESLLKADPFHTHGVATYQLIEFDPVKYAKALDGHLER
jgi:uncharacterized protein YciI